MMIYPFVLLLSVFSFGCESETTDEVTANRAEDTSLFDFKILALGDSALDWNDENATPYWLGRSLIELGHRADIENRAVSGATLGCGQGGVGNETNCIPPQYIDGDWSHILLSGGANDILDSNCTIDADPLISDDLSSGLMIDTINQLVEGGHKVIIYGYFRANDNGGEVSSCQALYTFLERLQTVGEARPNVLYIDAADAVTPARPELYDDEIHPSPEGSRRIGQLLAERLVDWEAPD